MKKSCRFHPADKHHWTCPARFTLRMNSMPKSNFTHPLFGDTPNQPEHRGTVFIVLNGDPSLYEPIKEALANGGFGIALVEDQWFRHFWKIQRQAGSAQTHNP